MKSGMGIVLAVAIACGAASAQQLFSAADGVFANEGRIGDRWALAPGATLATPAYPAALAPRGDDVCLAMGYMIGTDGSTSRFAVLKQWNSATEEREPVEGYWQAFAQSGADALSQWKFQPKPGATTRQTYTVATLAFTGTRGTPAADLRGHCRVDDLAALVQKRKSQNYMRNSRDRAELDRANQAAKLMTR
jgi:hypothetical protein